MNISKELELVKARYINRKMRMDAPDDNTTEEPQPQQVASVNHGNTRLPFGLCKKYGIEIKDGWTPRDAWNALADKGISADKAYDKVEKTGTVKDVKPDDTKGKTSNKELIDKLKSDLNDWHNVKATVKRQFFIDALSGKGDKLFYTPSSNDTYEYENLGNGEYKVKYNLMGSNGELKGDLNLIEPIFSSGLDSDEIDTIKISKASGSVPSTKAKTEKKAEDPPASPPLPPLETEPANIYVGDYSTPTETKMQKAFDRYKVARDTNRLGEFKGHTPDKFIDDMLHVYSASSATINFGDKEIRAVGKYFAYTDDTGKTKIITPQKAKELVKNEELTFGKTINSKADLKGTDLHKDWLEMLNNDDVSRTVGPYDDDSIGFSLAHLMGNMDKGETIKVTDGNGNDAYFVRNNVKFNYYGPDTTWYKNGKCYYATDMAHHICKMVGYTGKIEMSDASKAPKPPKKPKAPKTATKYAYAPTSGKNITKSYQAPSGLKPHEVLSDIMAVQGYDGAAKVVKADEFAKAAKNSGVLLVRTISGTSAKNADSRRQQFFDGKPYVECSGGAWHGLGMYTAGHTDGYVSNSALDTAWKASRPYGSGKTHVRSMIITMQPGAKIVDYSKIYNEYSSLSYDEKKKVGFDVGCYAAARGYDAAKAYHGSTDYVVIYNRSKLICLEPGENYVAK